MPFVKPYVSATVPMILGIKIPPRLAIAIVKPTETDELNPLMDAIVVG